MKKSNTPHKVVLTICWITLLGTLLSFESLMPLSQHFHALYAPMAQLSIGLYLFSFFILPLIAAAGLIFTLIYKRWLLTMLYTALIPAWFYVVPLVGKAI